MPDHANVRTRPVCGVRTLMATLALGASLAGCSSPKPAAPAAKRYPLAGQVISIDKNQNQVTVDAGDIPGFMSAMAMPYSVKDPKSLDSLTPGDKVTADVVVNGNDINLENLIVVKKTDEPKAAAPSDSHSAPAKPAKH